MASENVCTNCASAIKLDATSQDGKVLCQNCGASQAAPLQESGAKVDLSNNRVGMILVTIAGVVCLIIAVWIFSTGQFAFHSKGEFRYHLTSHAAYSLGVALMSFAMTCYIIGRAALQGRHTMKQLSSIESKLILLLGLIASGALIGMIILQWGLIGWIFIAILFSILLLANLPGLIQWWRKVRR